MVTPPAMPRFVSYIMAAMSCVQGIAELSAEMQNTLDQHNVYRCVHGLSPLEWDEDIAANAQAYAESSDIYTHSTVQYLLGTRTVNSAVQYSAVHC